ncbi:Uncharacterized membrane protein [Amycolatopsis arida]|uniref:Uncharacterized membrane protein n=1 Tax=Amycolatopsis arida TaxID=587909 RepID=A0A1I5P1I7_9PSEU|nr:DUF1622 domain-containing protein [Amycolatopsis arida]TDX98305.1 putative membrane protein [Amycolatopsis arida]SFP27371.1 Uncharacterized membrane protein [Amycolatopsis arida]
MNVEHLIQAVGTAVEVAGVVVIVVGALVATAVFGYRVTRGERSGGLYRGYRQSLGRAILLGLEFLVAGDIIGTVAVDPSLQSVGVLAAIVLVRTFLSFSLEVELEGRWPWQKPRGARHNAGGAAVTDR